MSKRGKWISPVSKGGGDGSIDFKDEGQPSFTWQRMLKRNNLVQFSFDELLQIGRKVSV